MLEILVLYYSRSGNTRAMAELVARGVDEVNGAQARLRTVPEVSSVCEAVAAPVPSDGPPYADKSDLRECAGIALGTPTRFGNMATPLKHFIDDTSDIWLSGALIGKPVTLFTSTSSLHGGQEATLLASMIPFLHHGMVFTGVPYSEPSLLNTTSGGTPYGASHWSGPEGAFEISEDEARICKAQGRHISQLAIKLSR